MENASIKIPSELFAMAESSRFDGQMSIPLLTIGPDDYVFEDPITWDVEVTNTGAALLVTGTAVARGMCSCARCLDDVEFSFNGEIEGYFLIEGAEAGEYDEDDEDVPGDDEFDVLPADHIINLEPLIKAALIIDAPQVPLCSEDCKGLCPNCGANLNDGPCACGGDPLLEEFERQSNPFAALANFKFD